MLGARDQVQLLFLATTWTYQDEAVSDGWFLDVGEQPLPLSGELDVNRNNISMLTMRVDAAVVPAWLDAISPLNSATLRRNGEVKGIISLAGITRAATDFKACLAREVGR